MTQWSPNQYHLFSKADSACRQTAIGLLNSYSLTKGCLETLGTALREQLEFGFFKPGSVIIQQGESGRDIFLLCNGLIDVLVNDQVVVQMSPPTLAGDKGIVSLNAQRAATIRIGGEEEALVIKVPMGNFIREFKDAKIADESFAQEKGIFQNVFQTVQQRLFDYVHLQKSLWEQVTNTLGILNRQILAKQLDNQKSPGWEAGTWQIVQQYLKTQYNISWPTNIPINEKNLYIFLRRLLDKKYPASDKPEVVQKKTKEWRSLLSNICNRVLKSLPDVKKPIPPLDLELFNPNIYRMRIAGLLSQLEKRYEDAIAEPPKIKPHPTAAFFGQGDRSNEFNLGQYLSYFERFYRIRNVNRLMAQVAQKCALIAAECENSFNVSVVKMQTFLTEVRSRNLALEDSAQSSTTDPVRLQTWIATLSRGIQHFQNTTNTVQAQTLGVIQFSPKTYPNQAVLLKSHRVQFTRDQMNQAFQLLIQNLGFQSEYLPSEVLQQSFHIVAIDRGDLLPEKELIGYYWFPLSDDLTLKRDNDSLVNLNACMLSGREFIREPGTDDSTATSASAGFHLTTEKLTLLFVLPPSYLPWTVNPNPVPERYIDQYLPLMQWFIDKSLDQFVYLVGCRDRVVSEWQEIQNAMIRSSKIEAFEKKPIKLPQDDLNRIITLLNNRLNMGLAPNRMMVSNQLSKKIYNAFLHKIKSENPELSVEQCGNQAYTQWRNLLFEIVGQIPALNKVVPKLPGKAPSPALNTLVTQLTPLLSPLMADIWDKRNPITSGTPNLNLLQELHPEKHASPAQAIDAFEGIVKVMAGNARRLIEEIIEHKNTLAALYEQQSGTDTSGGSQTAQIDILQESVQQLIKRLRGTG